MKTQILSKLKDFTKEQGIAFLSEQDAHDYYYKLTMLLEDLANNDNTEDALAKLNSTLQHELLDSGLVTYDQWNEAIAPKLSAVAMALEGANITARTYVRTPDDTGSPRFVPN